MSPAALPVAVCDQARLSRTPEASSLRDGLRYRFLAQKGPGDTAWEG